MIKVLKLQKAVIVLVLGIAALIVYKIMSANDMEQSSYMLSLSGILLMAGALMFLYPILFAKKVNDVEVQLDPEKQQEMVLEEQRMADEKQKIATTDEPLSSKP